MIRAGCDWGAGGLKNVHFYGLKGCQLVVGALSLAWALGPGSVLAQSKQAQDPSVKSGITPASAGDAAPQMPALLPRSEAEAELVFREANNHFLAGEMLVAIAGYQRLVQAGFGSADIEYNLGTAALKAGKLGLAVLSFERALALDPGHEQARANLGRARKRNVDKLVGVEAGPPFFERLARRLPPTLTGYAFAGFWALLFLLASIRRLGRLRGGLASTALIFVGLATLFSAGLEADLIWYRSLVKHAVVMEEVVPVRKGPAPRFETSFEIHQGLELRVIEADGPFLRVQLMNGLQGWVPRGSVEMLRLPGVGW